MARDYERYHTHHQSRRRPDWDYTQPAAYLVTICVQDRIRLFGHVAHGVMYPSAFGDVATEEWHRSETLRTEVHLDAFVVMPDHVHGIVVITPSDAACPTDPGGYVINAVPGPNCGETGDNSDTARRVAGSGSERRFGNPQPKSLGAMVRAYKSAVTRRINQIRDTPGGTVWQRNYHERLIRTEAAWHRIRQYIEANPARWTK